MGPPVSPRPAAGQRLSALGGPEGAAWGAAELGSLLGSGAARPRRGFRHPAEVAAAGGAGPGRGSPPFGCRQRPGATTRLPAASRCSPVSPGAARPLSRSRAPLAGSAEPPGQKEPGLPGGYRGLPGGYRGLLGLLGSGPASLPPVGWPQARYPLGLHPVGSVIATPVGCDPPPGHSRGPGAAWGQQRGMDVGLTRSKAPRGCSLPGGLPAPPAVSVTGDIGDVDERFFPRSPAWCWVCCSRLRFNPRPGSSHAAGRQPQPQPCACCRRRKRSGTGCTPTGAGGSSSPPYMGQGSGR